MSKNITAPLEYECECLDDKKFRVLFDGGDSVNYVVEYCEKCFGQDDKQFMVSMERLQ
ncbi:MAG: hypothetical protein OPY08_06415 [Nitrosopumilus sp.]|nr:hypothetical protein [Nitrosopumilus sp.]